MQEKITTEEEYRRAIMRFLEICDSEPGTFDFEEAKVLTELMEDYENKACNDYKKMN